MFDHGWHCYDSGGWPSCVLHSWPWYIANHGQKLFCYFTKKQYYRAFTETGATQTVKSQLVRWPVMFTWLRCQAMGSNQQCFHACAYFRSLVDLENKSCVRVPLVNIHHQSAWCRVWIFSCLKKPFKCLVKVVLVKLLTNHLKGFFGPSGQQWFNSHSGNTITSDTLAQLLFSKSTNALK